MEEEIIKTNKNNPVYNISLKFKDITIPPFRDILILAKKCPHGKRGITGCFQFLAPEEFELIEPDNSTIEAILVNKRLLKRMPVNIVLELLEQRVFPYISIGEMVRVDLDVTVQFDNIEIT
ncbi:MAG: hypothetical protein Q7J15_08215 [Candidatus Desulfaltia sp.]|nr:hypothetical protein [Candidatus Desulfaltia sp.]